MSPHRDRTGRKPFRFAGSMSKLGRHMAPVPGSRASDGAVQAGRGALFIGAAKVFFMVAGLAQKLLLTRVVGAAEYGIFSVVNVVVSVINNATVQGTIQSVSKFTAEDDSRADAVKRAGLRLQLVVGAALTLGFFLAAPLIASLYRDASYVRWFRLVAPIPFLYSLYSVFIGSANGLRRFHVQAGFDISFSTIKTILLLGGAAAFGVAGALGGFVAAAAVILVVAALVIGWPRSRAGAPAFPIRRLATFMVGIVVYTLLINAALNFDLPLLRRFAALAAPAEQANKLAGYYDALRNFSLLPYQALLIITFVIFPLVSRSTFEQDRETTRAYVTQTLRYALMLAAAMASVLCARPDGLLRLIYPPEYIAGATALPILVSGIVALSLLGVSGAIINASGHPRVAVALVSLTVVVGAGTAFLIVPGRSPGPPMLNAMASAAALGMYAGVAAALVYVRRRFEALPPLASVVRVLISTAAAVAVGRLMPGSGKLATIAALLAAGVVFLLGLILLGEFGPQDRAKFRRILGR
jgi:stage V sporulation protein B